MCSACVSCERCSRQDDPDPDRDPLPGDRQPDHDLRQVGPLVLRVPERPERRPLHPLPRRPARARPRSRSRWCRRRAGRPRDSTGRRRRRRPTPAPSPRRRPRPAGRAPGRRGRRPSAPGLGSRRPRRPTRSRPASSTARARDSPTSANNTRSTSTPKRRAPSSPPSASATPSRRQSASRSQAPPSGREPTTSSPSAGSIRPPPSCPGIGVAADRARQPAQPLDVELVLAAEIERRHTANAQYPRAHVSGAAPNRTWLPRAESSPKTAVKYLRTAESGPSTDSNLVNRAGFVPDTFLVEVLPGNRGYGTKRKHFRTLNPKSSFPAQPFYKRVCAASRVRDRPRLGRHCPGKGWSSPRSPPSSNTLANPLEPRDIHAAAEELLGQPLKCSSVKATLAEHVGTSKAAV